ncbi:hypothetical protein ELH49_36855 [Rhizobium ruizarguesonis]|uniref:hypothetical protein n=1 Tax=Rhizobium ruizarguesonis TaxID=2081791 RepID=UPI000425ED67|nr:hypothetical protein [Rhizobium ruizarguesonis]QJS31299.1 hypothetical protein RLTA1_28690 [Rhizobium leguminosarum bv. trifolii TA1]TBB35876.1 hypothetical protein ELH49_36855 [Rhizobium ruizarguesonis]UFW98112.1 hypothetical protein RlegTA1_28635 [Rhizobium ruizarguesonis]
MVLEPRAGETLTTLKFEPSRGSLIGHIYTTNVEKSISVAVIAMLPPICIIILSWAEHVLISPSLHLDLIHDAGFFAQYVLLLPAVVLGMGLLTADFPTRLEAWRNAGLFKVNQSGYEEAIKLGNSLLESRFVQFLPVIFAAFCVVYGAYLHTFSDKNTWHSPNYLGGYPTISGLITLFVRFILYFLVCHFFISTFSCIIVFKKIIQNGVNLNVVHSDASAGLSDIGEYWLKYYLSILIVGLLFLLLVYIVQSTAWGRSFTYLIVLLSYSVALACGFLPIYYTHKAMYSEKLSIMSPVDRAISNTLTFLLSENSYLKSEDEDLERRLKFRQTLLENIATWPYNFKGFSFLTVSLLPAALSILDFVTKVGAFLGPSGSGVTP